MLDLLFREIFGVVGFQGHAIVTHALRSVLAHPVILTPFDLAILLVQ